MTPYHNQCRRLNPKQRDAFDSQGNTVVIAGPGSGKTRVLSLKVAKLLRNEIMPPQGIACLTYTRAMAKELEKKLYSLGIDTRPNIVIDTIHGFCLGYVIKPFSRLYELDIPYPIRIAPQTIWDECLNIARQEIKRQEYNPGQDQSFKTELVKYHLQRIDQPYHEWSNQDYARIIEHLYSCLREKGFIDFDLIIKYGLDLIANQPFVRQCLCAKFPWFAVDEYQDLGYPLFRIITEMLDNTPINLFAIGDPDQSIYGYIGTDPQYLHELAARDDVLNYIQLNINYRSTRNIIQICKNILSPASDYDSNIEIIDSKCVVYEVGERNGRLRQLRRVVEKLIEKYVELSIPLHEIAILHPWRPNNETTTEGIKFVAAMLDETGIVYYLDQYPLYDRSKRLLQWLEELAVWCLSGWTASEGQAIYRKCDFEEIQHYWEVINSGQYVEVEYDSDVRVALTTALWEVKGQNLLLRDWLNYLQRHLRLDEVLSLYGNEFPDEVDEFKKLVKVSAEGEVLADLHIDEFAHMQSAIQLTTLHSSKGMEFEAVIIAGVERIWNDDNGNRLLYVGATRAKQQLSLIYRNVWPIENPTMPAYVRRLIDNCSNLGFFTHHSL